MVVFYAGGNDINANKSPATVLADYQAFVAQVRARLPAISIVFISLATSPRRWTQVEKIRKANGLVADYSKTDPNLKFLDIFPFMLDEKGQPRPELYVSDQLHMTSAGYAIWTKALAPLLPPKAVEPNAR